MTEETVVAENVEEEILNQEKENLGSGDAAKQKLTKAQKKKLKKKKSKANKKTVQNGKEDNVTATAEDVMDVEDDDVEIEYIPEEVGGDDSVFKQYTRVFAKFRTGIASGEDEYDRKMTPAEERRKMLERKKPVELELKDEDETGEPKLSKKKLRLMTRMSVADLKTVVSNPELVEMHDVTSKDPAMLLAMKSTRNSVPVPRHWCYKRKYLQGKRGFEKPPFKLPEFIRKTGIQEMREAVQEKEDTKTLKTKMKEKMRPKMGKIDIDYQKLHDAFFRWQTKPKMSIHGDLYYEGKEFETRLKSKKPGDLTAEIRTALGMPTGVNAHKVPPPWLIAMQRYGPPPSYPNIKIAGLNAPIPDGCSFGYHAGGWGKPPVDEYGRPLYGDVFGISSSKNEQYEEEVDTSLWGELEEESEEEESEEEEAEQEEEDEDGDAPVARKAPQPRDDATGFQTPMTEGMVTPSGMASVPSGLETPGMIELRKRKIEAEMDSEENRELYTVLSEKKTDKIRGDMMASTHTYEVSSIKRKDPGVNMAIDPSDLELDPAEMNAKLEKSLREQQGSTGAEREDLSDMVADHVARTKKQKTSKESSKDAAKSKKYKDFKF
ncbi:Splicing factor 3B subunit 2 [Halotydeus destructor]|nr:Splicing factor 3B subunit 2 [Halotydeus destructor]